MSYHGRMLACCAFTPTGPHLHLNSVDANGMQVWVWPKFGRTCRMRLQEMSCQTSSMQGSCGEPAKSAAVRHGAVIHQALPATQPRLACLLCQKVSGGNLSQGTVDAQKATKNTCHFHVKQNHLASSLIYGDTAPTTASVPLFSIAPTTACCARHYRVAAVKVTPAEPEQQHQPSALHSSSITADGPDVLAQVVLVEKCVARQGKLGTPYRQSILFSPPPAPAQHRLKVPASCLHAGLQPLLEGANDGIRGGLSEELQEPLCPLLPCTRRQLL